MKWLLLNSALAVIYFGAGWLGQWMAITPGNVTAVWPPSGIALAALLLFGYRVWPGIWLGSFLVNSWTFLDSTSLHALLNSLSIGSSISVGETLSALLSAHLLHRFSLVGHSFSNSRNVIIFMLLAGGVGPVVAPTIGVASLVLGELIPIELGGDTWWTWYLGNAVGVIVIAPVLLVWNSKSRELFIKRKPVEGLLLLFFLIAAAMLTFGGWLKPEGAHYPIAFLTIPALVWAAYRFGPTGATLATFLVTAIAIVGAVHGGSPFQRDSLNESLLLLETYISVIAITTLILAANVVERNRSEHRLKKSREKLRALSARVLSVQEEEKKRIARAVHDELGHALTALKFDVSFIQQDLAKDQNLLREKTIKMSQFIDETIQQVRRIAEELRPAILDDAGIVAGIEWDLKKIDQRTGIKCEFSYFPHDLEVDPEQATALFRAMQEAMTNVARHADATNAKIQLDKINGEVRLQIKDNGKGISKKEMKAPKAFGLMGIRERVMPWGGKVEITGVKGEGTLVSITIPSEVEKDGRKVGKNDE